MRILVIGDIVGEPGRKAITGLLPGLKEEYSLDFVVANAENASGGSGITSRVGNELFRAGCHVLTMGDHVWNREEGIEYLKECRQILRPANFPEETPGYGWCIAETAAKQPVGVINLLGRVFMRYNVDCPFRALKRIVDEIKKQGVRVIVVDIHAEATSEKVAMGRFIDGEISLVFGTHTHIATADEDILPLGTAYITDLGMTGPYDSVIGQNKDEIIKRFITSMPTRFEVAKNDIRLSGAVVDIDEETGKARKIFRVQRRLL